MSEHLTRFEPDWVSPPGDTIADLLAEKGWTQTDLALRTGYTKKHINELVVGKASITPEAALKLETALGGAAAFWLTRESQFREAFVRREAEERLAREAAWLDELPLTSMVKQGWVRKVPGAGRQVAECLRFFGVASVDAWREAYERPLCAFRVSPRPQMRVGSIAAWLRKGEIEASKIECVPFDAAALRRTLDQLRALTTEPAPGVFIPALVSKAAAAGVAVVFVPAPTGCPAFGVTKWLTPAKALLQLSLRYRTNDQLWFTLFHEAGHLVLHGKRLMFFEGADSVSEEHEDEANRFATNLLIPEHEVARMRQLPASHAAIEDFARKIGIAPGIVVGRLQKEGHLPWSHLNALKVRYTWADSRDNPGSPRQTKRGRAIT
jgi:HTH-type transcriptional regulator / antitoxin HigA